jgi:two-component system response regulator (stage 0 sporulation protein F)
VRTAADGVEALRMLDSFVPDALVLDYGLPGIDGVQTYLEIVRRCARDVPCTMITGTPTEQLVQRARGCGIRHVVCKPFGFSALLRLLAAPKSLADERASHWDAC